MRFAKLAAVLCAAMWFGGCDVHWTVSLHPIYDEQTLVFEPALVGTWGKDGDESEQWKFRGLGEESYRLVITDRSEGETDSLDVHLVRVAGITFVDFCSRDSGITDIPGHYWGKLVIDRDAIRIAFLNHSWVKEKVVRQGDLEHFLITSGHRDGLLVVTAPTSELQYFLLQYGADPEAFGDAIELRRREAWEEKP